MINPAVDEIARWRDDKWWLSPEYVQGYQQKISPDEVDASVAAVLQVFNSAWAAEDAPHAAFYELFSRGWQPLNAVVGLGRNLLSIKGTPGFRELVDALRNAGAYESAKLELSLAALFRECGFEISLRPGTQNGKAADLLTRINGEEVCFEVKIVQESEDAIAMHAFTTRLMPSLDDLCRNLGFPSEEFKYQLVLGADAGESHAKRITEEPGFLHILIAETLESVSQRLKAWSIAFNIPKLGSFRLASKDVLSESRMSTPIDTEAELGRMIRSRLTSAIRQLDSTLPGIVVFRTHGIVEEIPSNAIVREPLRAKGDMASHLIAIVFLPIVYTLFGRWSPFEGFAVLNPISRFPAADLQAFQLLSKECSLRVFDS